MAWLLHSCIKAEYEEGERERERSEQKSGYVSEDSYLEGDNISVIKSLWG